MQLERRLQGNPNAALGRWDIAEKCFGKAAELAPEFAFAAGNHALALYQLGRDDEAIRQMRCDSRCIGVHTAPDPLHYAAVCVSWTASSPCKYGRVSVPG